MFVRDVALGARAIGDGEHLDAVGIGYSLGTDGTELLEGISTVVKSPGVPEAAPVIAAAAAAGE